MYKQRLHVKNFFLKFLNSIKLFLLFSTEISSSEYWDVHYRVQSTEMSHMLSSVTPVETSYITLIIRNTLSVWRSGLLVYNLIFINYSKAESVSGHLWTWTSRYWAYATSRYSVLGNGHLSFYIFWRRLSWCESYRHSSFFIATTWQNKDFQISHTLKLAWVLSSCIFL
jgi:hypothetical protein